MKLKLILTTAIVGVALALPSVSSAAPPAPTFQDSVSLTAAPGVALTPNPFFAFTIFDLNATSGPRGENPSGQVRFATLNLNIQLGGPVTCLAVSGNTATINFQDQMTFAGSIITVQVVDDQPDTFSLGPINSRAPTDCSPLLPPFEIDPFASGDITVVDAQVPTTTDQCKGDGWKQIGFANQGLCLAFVNRGP